MIRSIIIIAFLGGAWGLVISLLAGPLWLALMGGVVIGIVVGVIEGLR